MHRKTAYNDEDEEADDDALPLPIQPAFLDGISLTYPRPDFPSDSYRAAQHHDDVNAQRQADIGGQWPAGDTIWREDEDEVGEDELLPAPPPPHDYVSKARSLNSGPSQYF